MSTSRREFLASVAFLPQAYMDLARTVQKEEVSKKKHSLLNEVMQPFASEANARRERHARDAFPGSYETRVDRELNSGRVNFLLAISGYDYQPPSPWPVILDSQTIISFNLETGQFDTISLTHDTRAPEIERYLQRADDGPNGPIKITEARTTGGFRLARRVFENATGLAVDFQLALTEDTVAKFVDEVLGGLKVNVPQSFEVLEFYYQNKKYPRGQFQAGEQILDGLRVIQFIKTVPSENGGYDKNLEHNARKFIVLKALTESMKEHALDVGFWISMKSFLESSFKTEQQKNELNTGILTDFKLVNLILKSLPPIIRTVFWARIKGEEVEVIPETGKSVYVVDGRSGDGGVVWVNADDNPLTKEEKSRGRYGKDMAYEVPYEADPYADDLVTGYWKSVRELVKRKLTG